MVSCNHDGDVCSHPDLDNDCSVDLVVKSTFNSNRDVV